MTAVAIDTDPIRVGIKEQAEQAKRRGKGGSYFATNGAEEGWLVPWKWFGIV